jgi:hypothetical protein
VERVAFFTDAQAAIKRIISEDLGPGQIYAIQARKYIAALRRGRPGVIIEIRWCPAHKGETGRPTNGPSSQWKNQTLAGWNGYGTRFGSVRRAADGPSQVSRSPQTGNLRAEARNPLMVWEPGHRQEIQAAEQAAAGWDSGR